ncbi:MAG: hypothetical protein EOM67_15705, partial [Spirochaetia bacterium]|nr:hypothetical protein [Spirochaetia bacterium]
MFLVLKDPHLRIGLGNPIGRKETFQQEIKSKLAFILGYACTNGITNIIFTGDVLDIKAPSKYDYPAIRALKDELEIFRANGIKLWTILGNHDLPMASRDMYSISVIHDFVRDGYLRLLGSKPLKLDDAYVYGINYVADQSIFEKELAEIDAIELNDGIKKLVVLHEHIIPDDAYEGHVHFYKYSQMCSGYKNINGFICGHLHRGFPTQMYKKRLFVNPWSLTRLARNYYVLNDEHVPTMVHVKSDLSFEDIPIPCVSFEEGFNEQEFEKAVELDLDLAGFANTITAFVTDGETSLESLNLPEQVKEKVEHYILEAKGKK